MRTKYLALACCAAALAASPAGAVVTVGGFSLDTGSFGTGLGVHSDNTQSGTTVSGNVNGDGSDVTFSSSTALSLTGSGEATVLPVTGSITDLTVLFEKAWNNITFSFAAGANGTFTLFVNGAALFNDGNCSICTIGKNGQNKFTLSGTGITSLAYTFDPGVDTAKQFRVEGVSDAPAVPEPATWAMMLIGFGGVGFQMRRHRRKVALFAQAA